mgnify:CR=1 FL=1
MGWRAANGRVVISAEFLGRIMDISQLPVCRGFLLTLLCLQLALGGLPKEADKPLISNLITSHVRNSRQQLFFRPESIFPFLCRNTRVELGAATHSLAELAKHVVR